MINEIILHFFCFFCHIFKYGTKYCPTNPLNFNPNNKVYWFQRLENHSVEVQNTIIDINILPQLWYINPGSIF